MAGIAALPESLTFPPFAIVVSIIAASCKDRKILLESMDWMGFDGLWLWKWYRMGLLYLAMSLDIQASAPVKDAAAAGFFAFFQALDKTVGGAIVNGILQIRILAKLKAIPDSTILAATFGYA
ncbi:hypothetical protein DSL72_006036 [Monilinia vaccinii-corymbosi]|uniref:Uncharacterized protein n=1 Tax=Monilinia vaccinii-corymbosi TaxID=61207 RepID=A0A8A3PHE4_9HELO|nr:hypothetical protein DSL72_006036 [Monilinia vaccinii-corymbosi]